MFETSLRFLTVLTLPELPIALNQIKESALYRGPHLDKRPCVQFVTLNLVRLMLSVDTSKTSIS